MMSEEQATPSKPLVLVVDDDRMIRLLAKDTLRQAGYRVREAEDGEAALVEFAAEIPDVVLLDVMLPRMDGFMVCKTLRQHPQGGNVPILIMTSLDDPESIRKGFEAGATDFEIKPLNWVVLSYRVRYLVRAGNALEIVQAARSADAPRAAHLGGWHWDIQHNRVEWSRVGRQLFGLPEPPVETTHEGFLIYVHPGDRARVSEMHGEALRSRQAFEIDYRIVRPDGVQRVIQEQAEVTLDSRSGRAAALHATVQDVTDLRQTQEKIRYLAFYDFLTGLLNRQAFQQELQRALDYADRHQRLVGVLFVDLDNFKRINDTLGHAAGDALLKVVADRLQKNVRRIDFVARPQGEETEKVARLGGDEFVLMLTDMERAEDAATVAERLLNLLNQPVRVGDYEVAVTPSIGIAVFPHDGRDVDHLLRNADLAMYQAKATGKNTYKYYNDSMNARALRRLDLEYKLRQALERGEFELHYQPQVDLCDRLIVGVEALLRWHQPTLGWVSPEEFIALAEETGLIVPIGTWALQLACTQGMFWRNQYPGPLRLAVNLGGLQLRQRNLATLVEQILNDTGLPPADLELELTEQSLMQNAEENLAILSRLRTMGVSLSVDDFGTGYSSLRYLRRFPLNKLKIDRSFIQGVPNDTENATITGTIITLAHKLGLKVIAEGVETATQQAFLRAQGCDEAQGHLFGEPLSAERLGALLAQHAQRRHPSGPNTPIS
jgi:diguanylate cyclase (GGDEF)-like protein/PAS domain S-box-containing protein